MPASAASVWRGFSSSGACARSFARIRVLSIQSCSRSFIAPAKSNLKSCRRVRWRNGCAPPAPVFLPVPAEREVVFHSENGVLGMGPAPAAEEINRWLINAGKQYVTLRKGGAYMHHADSFGLIRGGHLDLCVLGAFQVAENGDIANWSTSDNDSAPAVGGALDLAAGARQLWVLMG